MQKPISTRSVLTRGSMKSWPLYLKPSSDQFEIFSRFLAKAEVHFWCIQAQIKKHARWIQH